MSVEHFPDRVTMLLEDKRRIDREHPPRVLYVGEYTVTLNRPCYPCEGRGWRLLLSKRTGNPLGDEPCPFCAGRGRRSTPEGDAIVAHLRDMGLLP